MRLVDIDANFSSLLRENYILKTIVLHLYVAVTRYTTPHMPSRMYACKISILKSKYEHILVLKQSVYIYI